MKKNSPSSWVLDYLILSICWGTSFLLMREATLSFGPFLCAWLRVSIAALVLVPYIVHRGEFFTLLKNWKKMVIAGLLSCAFPFCCYFYALSSLSTGLSSVLNATTPMFGALIAWVWLREKPKPLRVLGLLIGFIGITCLILSASKPGEMHNNQHVVAVSACLAATFCYGLGANYTQKYMREFSPLLNATGCLVGASVALLVPAILDLPSEWPTVSSTVAIVLSGVFSTAIAYALFFRIISKIGAARSMTITYLVSVIATVLGLYVLNESITILMVLSALLVLLGTALSSGLIQKSKSSEITY
jgi:drug/metabolite transporter (DMT)-like permease